MTDSVGDSALPTYDSLAGQRTRVTHHRIGQISVMRDRFTAIDEQPAEVEIAFFDTDGNWLLDTVEEFAAYAEPPAGDTRVYTGVPLEQVQQWVAQHTSRSINLAQKPASQRTVDAPGTGSPYE